MRQSVTRKLSDFRNNYKIFVQSNLKASTFVPKVSLPGENSPQILCELPRRKRSTHFEFKNSTKGEGSRNLLRKSQERTFDELESESKRNLKVERVDREK